MRTEPFVPYEQKTSILQIVSYTDKNPRGYLKNPYFPAKKSFSNLTQLLFLMDGLLDAMDYPQCGTEPRTFVHTAPHPLSDAPDACETGETVLATFRLSVLFRQNASWQGSIQWVEQNSVSQFRSALELIGLLDSVLAPFEKN